MKKFSGVYTALITPFKSDTKEVDYHSLKKIVQMQAKSSVSGIVVVGTTGEGSTLSHDEHIAVVNFVLNEAKTVRSSIEIIAGTGSNSTSEAIELSVKAASLGVDALLVVNPYYNKSTQNGLVEHFCLIASSVSDTPIILYNVPGRTGMNISNDTIVKIAKRAKNVVGIKDATGDLARVPLLISDLRSEKVENFSILSGEDMTILGFNASGGCGVISVISNVIPDLTAELEKIARNGSDRARAIDLQHKLTEISDVMFCETNPIPVKYALHLLGLCENSYRMPLMEPCDESKMKIKQALKNLNLL